MIDFHDHILPGIDDGSRDIEETLVLLKEAKNVGFDKIILTPHYKEGFYQVEVEEKTELFNKVVELAEREVPGLQLYLGNEIMATGNIVEYLDENKASTLNETRYVLFELPMNSKPVNFSDIVYEMKSKKLIPVLAHPERYFFVQDNPEIIYDWIEQGVLMQQNFGSIIGQYGKKAKIIAKKMLENDSVHFLGSDVHRPNTVYANMSKSIDKIEKIVGEEMLEELTVINPSHVLSNEKFDINTPYKIKLGFSDKLKMKMK